MIDSGREGVIKFQLDFHSAAAPQASLLKELNAWRCIFLQLGMIGQDPRRYQGFGFGNLSRRIPGRDGNTFIISGTQTGHLQKLQPRDYATVLNSDPTANQLSASGQVKPSSEALSHAVLYQASAETLWVMHLHCPSIFAQRKRLGLPCTAPTAGYGTPEMAAELRRLTQGHDPKQAGLLVMTGHQDGIMVYGPTAVATGNLAVATLALALQHQEQL